MIVDGGYNLPEGTPVDAVAEKAAAEKVAGAEAGPMSTAIEPETERPSEAQGSTSSVSRSPISGSSCSRPSS